jgi:hypothetical protein
MTKEEFIGLHKNAPDMDYIRVAAERIFAPENHERQRWLIDGFDVVNGEMVRKSTVLI